MNRLLAALALLLVSTSALAASRVWIAEFVAIRIEPLPIATLPAKVLQPTIDISAGTSKRSAVFDRETRYIRIVCEVQCAISEGTSVTTSAILLPALKPEYFAVNPSTLISVIAAP